MYVKPFDAAAPTVLVSVDAVCRADGAAARQGGPLSVNFVHLFPGRSFPCERARLTVLPRTRLRHAVARAACLYLAFALGWSRWKPGSATGPEDKPRRRTIAAGDLPALRDAVAKARRRFELSDDAPVCSGYGGGRDGFWLHRLLDQAGVDNRAGDSASTEVNGRAKRAKTERMDVNKPPSMLARHHPGEAKVWSVASFTANWSNSRTNAAAAPIASRDRRPPAGWRSPSTSICPTCSTRSAPGTVGGSSTSTRDCGSAWAAGSNACRRPTHPGASLFGRKLFRHSISHKPPPFASLAPNRRFGPFPAVLVQGIG